MLIDFPSGVIQVDKKPLISDLRINLAPNQQARLKMKVLNENVEKPIDLVIDKYTFPSLDGLSNIRVSIRGREMLSSDTFKLDLGYNFIKKKWNIEGKVREKKISQSMDHIAEIITIVKEFI